MYTTRMHGNIDRTASNRRYGPTAAAAARMKMHHFRHLKAAEMATPAVAARRARHLLNNQGGRRQPNACSCFQATHINVREGFFISEVFLYYCLAWITKHPF